MSNESNYTHEAPASIGILLTNLGTPDAPTSSAVRRYLAEFLSDPRVVEIPRLIWLIILYGIILPLRPKQSAALYKKIWTEHGSPLQVISQQQAQCLQQDLRQRISVPVFVVQAMRYGAPSIAKGLRKLRSLNAQRILVFPLYPQYSAATTASTWDAINQELQGWRWLPAIRMINQYAENESYIDALVASIKAHWETAGRGDKLLFSFHGLPKRCLYAGDPYFTYCHRTASLVAEKLTIPKEAWEVVFQSRFGRAEWLQPYCEPVLKDMPGRGLRSVDIICPGFSADCLETLEEIAQQYRDVFLQAGGEQFHYIPALNASDVHMQALTNIALQNLQGWI